MKCPACSDRSCLICTADWSRLARRISDRPADIRARASEQATRQGTARKQGRLEDGRFVPRLQPLQLAARSDATAPSHVKSQDRRTVGPAESIEQVKPYDVEADDSRSPGSPARSLPHCHPVAAVELDDARRLRSPSNAALETGEVTPADLSGRRGRVAPGWTATDGSGLAVRVRYKRDLLRRLDALLRRRVEHRPIGDDFLADLMLRMSLSSSGVQVRRDPYHFLHYDVARFAGASTRREALYVVDRFWRAQRVAWGRRC